jgi:hypothetical protein
MKAGPDGSVALNTLATEASQRHAAARRVQAFVTGNAARREYLAAKVCTSMRSTFASRCHSIKLFPSGSVASQAAACKIQACLRGAQLRRELELLKEAGRPVRLRFGTAKSRANAGWQKIKAMRMLAASGSCAAEVVVTEPGPLGVTLASDSEGGPPRVHDMVAGGHLSRHPEVRLGMTLLAVDGQVVSSYSQGMPLLDAAGRPVRLQFSAAIMPFETEELEPGVSGSGSGGGGGGGVGVGLGRSRSRSWSGSRSQQTTDATWRWVNYRCGSSQRESQVQQSDCRGKNCQCGCSKIRSQS